MIISDDLTPVSLYVEGHDGVRLAVFLYGDVDPAHPRPVIWTYNRYNRASMSRELLGRWLERFPSLGKTVAEQDGDADVLRLSEPLAALTLHGYLVAIVDIRGTGSSLGTHTEPFSAAETLDAVAVMDWFLNQPFCDGNLGMVGRSYMGANQHVVAGAAQGRLSAIMPEMAPFDLYTTIYRGGIFRQDFASWWFSDVDRRDRHDDKVAVGGPEGAAMLDRIRADHHANSDLYAIFSRLGYRDSVDPRSGKQFYLTNSPCLESMGFRQPNVPSYHIAGWFDPFVKDALLWFANIKGPKRLTIGPWAHSGRAGIDLGKEYRRWFDQWLRTAGTETEPVISYYTLGADPGDRWRRTETWPPAGVHSERLYLAEGTSGTTGSVNDGRLSGGTSDGHDRYAVDYSASSGRSTQWTNVYGGPFGYPDMRTNDARCLTYTSAPLAHAFEVTGHPITHLWVSSTAPDGDFFVYLEQVTEDGTSTYVTEGCLRASHRRLGRPPFDHLGLPYHRHYEADVRDIGDGPVELVFDLSPISWKFPAGSRIRVAIACTDADNAPAPELDPPPVVSVHHSAEFSSFINLPVSAGSCLSNQ